MKTVKFSELKNFEIFTDWHGLFIKLDLGYWWNAHRSPYYVYEHGFAHNKSTFEFRLHENTFQTMNDLYRLSSLGFPDLKILRRVELVLLKYLSKEWTLSFLR